MRVFDNSVAGLLSLNGMSKASSLTVIDERHLRGVLAPPSVITKGLLEDIVDFITLSAPDVAHAIEARVAEADRKNAWVSASAIERRLKTRGRSPK